jgi:hypothetical protein
MFWSGCPDSRRGSPCAQAGRRSLGSPLLSILFLKTNELEKYSGRTLVLIRPRFLHGAITLQSVLATKLQEEFIGRDSPSRVTRRSDRDRVTAWLQLTGRIRSLDIVDVRRLRRLKMF